MVEVNITDTFRDWWGGLTVAEQISVERSVDLLRSFGISLDYPHSSKISGNSKLRELRIQHKGRPYRVLYAFDPKREAILLIGGDKTGNNRWYEIFVPLAGRLYREYISRRYKGDHNV